MKNPRDGTLYFELYLGHRGPPDWHRAAVLELDPGQLEEPVTLEAGPETKIALRPSGDDSGNFCFGLR